MTEAGHVQTIDILVFRVFHDPILWQNGGVSVGTTLSACKDPGTVPGIVPRMTRLGMMCRSDIALEQERWEIPHELHQP